MNRTKLSKVETCAVFVNADRSILKLNKLIKKFGYTFIVINPAELEKKYSALFSLPKGYKSKGTVQLGDSNITVSNEFHNLVLSYGSFGMRTMMDRELILLKKTDKVEYFKGVKYVDMANLFPILGEFQKFSGSLIQQLRLLKNGSIGWIMQFQIMSDSRHILSKQGGFQDTAFEKKYTFTDDDIKKLKKSFKLEFKANPLTDLALKNFNLCYTISDTKTRYITLMTCLESLFNQGRDQITHTISRHLSLIISQNREEFERNYYRIKTLYRYRSAIVHGDKIEEKLREITDELQNMSRQAINFCIYLSLTKKQLFDKLNVMGYN